VSAFVAQNSNTVLAVLNNGLSGQALRVVGGSGIQYFSAPVQVPSGALLKSLRLDECDQSGVGNVGATLVVADSSGNVETTSTTLTSDGSGCDSLTADLTSLALTVDNNAKHYYIVASLTNAGAPLVGLAGVVVAYQLQVSPAPGAATFGDVPTNHPFFQFVEALAASGITEDAATATTAPTRL
jgi:hypothetical protein